MTLVRLVYYSGVHKTLTKDDLKQILASSHVNNKLYDVTGVLLFNRTTFVQVLEGRRQEVLAIYERISADRRHNRPVPVSMVDIQTRDFGQWAMAFVGEDVFTAELCRRYCGAPDLRPDVMSGTALYAMILELFAGIHHDGGHS